MRVVDGHVHVWGEATDASDLLRTMDANGVERTILISRPERVSLQQTRSRLEETARLVKGHADRLGALAWVNPTITGMIGLATEALTEMGFTGIKIIPDHFYVYEERLEPFWQRMHELRARMLFHTGILWGNDDGSRFCLPVYMEKLLAYPNIRFAMAHISWPWCEECLAVMGRMRAATQGQVRRWQSYIDLTPGAPEHIRKQAVANAISYCGADRLLFGSDSVYPADMAPQKDFLAWFRRCFEDLSLSTEQTQRILAGTADELFPPCP